MAVNSLKILAVDDNTHYLAALKAVVEAALPDAAMVTAPGGPQALMLAQAEDPDVILLDIMMPGMDGYEVCRRLKADERTCHIPVVFLTALRTDREARVLALDAGAEAFLTKPLDEVELTAQIRAMAKIKAAAVQIRHEQVRLVALVSERTRELERQLAERERADETLRTHELKFQAVVAQASDGIVLADEAGRIIEWNRQQEIITGIRSDEAVGVPIWEMQYRIALPQDQTPEALVQLQGFIEMLLQTRQSAFFNRVVARKIRRADGDVRSIESTLYPIRFGERFLIGSATRDVTEREQKEAALRESEARYRALFENMAAACCVDELIYREGRAVDYRILDVNPAWERILGIPRDRAVGLPASEVYGMSPAPLFDVFSRVAETGKPAEFEAHYAPVGKDLYFTVGSPGPGRFSTVFTDMTERKRAEQALRKSEADLAEAQRLAQMGSWIFDPASNSVSWSEESYRIFDFEQAAFDGSYASYLQRIHPDDRPRVLARSYEIRASGGPFEDEYRLVDRAGAIKYVREVGHATHDATGKVVQLLGVVQDITQRKRAELALRAEHDKLQAIMSALPVGILVLDENENMVDANPTAERMFGHTLGELQNRRCGDFIGCVNRHTAPAGCGHTENCAACPLIGAIRQVLAGGARVDDRVAEVIYDGCSPDHHRWLTVNVVPFVNGGVRHALLSLVDFTERKRAEIALRESEETLALFIEHSPIYAYIKEATPNESRVLKASANFQDMLGIPGAQMVGKTMPELFPAEFAAKMIADDWAVVTAGAVLRLDEDLYDRHYTTIKFPIRQSDRILLAGYSIDITERKRTEEALRRSAAQQAILNETLLTITARQELPVLLRNLVEKAAGLLGTTEGGLYLCDPEKQQCRCEVSFGTLHDYTGTVLNYGEGAAGTVAQTGRPLIIADYRTWSGRAAVFEADMPFQAVIAMPIIWHGQVTGVMHVLRPGTRPFTQADQDLLTQFAAHAAIAIEDARLVQGLQQELARRTQAEAALRQANERLTLAQHAAGAGMWDWDMTTGLLAWSPELFRLFGLDPEETTATFDVWRSVLHPQDRQQAEDRINAAIRDHIPLINEYRIILPSDEIRWIYAVGDTVYDAQDQPRRMSGFYLDVTERRQAETERQTLLEIMQGLTTAEDLQAYLGLVHRALAKVIFAENFFVILKNKDTGFFEEVYAVDPYDQPSPPSLLEKSICAYVFRSGEPLLLTREHFAELTARGEVQLVGADSPSWLGVPLITAKETIGVMVVQDYVKENRYSERDKEFLASIAGQVAQIVERKRTEDELKEAKEQFEMIFNLNPDAAVITDLADGRVTAINPGVTAMAGYAREDLLGKTTLEVGLWENPQDRQQMIAKLLQHGYCEDFESVFRRQDGGRIIGIASAKLFAVRGRQHVITFTRDITDRKRAEAALRESEERFRAVVETAPDAIFIQVGGCFAYLNPAAVALFAVSRAGQLLERPVVERFHPDYRAIVAERIRLLNEQRLAVPEIAEKILRSDGRAVDVAVSAVPFAYRGQVGALVFARDITERKRAEEEIRQLNADLERRVVARTKQLQDANRELEAFAYSVSHDLRAPLRGIDGWSQALLEDYGDRLDAQAQVYLGRVRSEAQRMGRLIDALLHLSRVTRADIQKRPVDLSAMAQGVIAQLRANEPQRQVEVSIQPELTARGDTHLLEIVLTNLLGNAWKFTGPRSQAHIEFGMLADRVRPADETADPAGAEAHRRTPPVFFVRDNGVGFDMAYAQKLFGAFQRMHGATEFPGTGIGLATVQRIVQRHGGRVWAEALVDQGAIFYFTLEEAA